MNETRTRDDERLCNENNRPHFKLKQEIILNVKIKKICCRQNSLTFYPPTQWFSYDVAKINKIIQYSELGGAEYG